MDEVSRWDPGCALSLLHGSNRPDAPLGDEESKHSSFTALPLLHALQEQEVEEEEKEN